MIEQIENFGAELQAPGFAKGKALNNREVHIILSRPAQHIAADVADVGAYNGLHRRKCGPECPQERSFGTVIRQSWCDKDTGGHAIEDRSAVRLACVLIGSEEERPIFPERAAKYAAIDVTLEHGSLHIRRFQKWIIRIERVIPGETRFKLTGTGANLLPTFNVGRTALVIAPNQPSTLYASIAGLSPEGLWGRLYKTNDGGQNWTRLRVGSWYYSSGPSSGRLIEEVDYCGFQCWYDNAVAVDPQDANIVFVAGQLEIFRSLDGGAMWAGTDLKILMALIREHPR